jgi:hypothetical protein
MALTGSSLTLLCLLTLKFQADLTGFCRNTICCEKIFLLAANKTLIEMLQQDFCQNGVSSLKFQASICISVVTTIFVCQFVFLVPWCIETHLFISVVIRRSIITKQDLETCIEFVLIKMF